MKAKIFFVVLAAVIAPFKICAQGVFMDSTGVKFTHIDYQDAVADANEHYDGDLFIYFFRNHSDNHRDVVSNGLANDTLSEYVNSNFARIAVDTSTDEGEAILKEFREDLPDWDFMVLRSSDASYRTMHGWGNVGNGSSAANWLTGMQDFKNRLPLRMPDVLASDTAGTYTLLRVESAVEGREVGFKSSIFSPEGRFTIRLEGKTTPYEERLTADQFVALFRNLDPEIGMVVSYATVQDDSTWSQGNGTWDFTMVMKRGERIMTAGL